VAAAVSRLEDRSLMSTFAFKGFDWSTDYRDNLAEPGWYSSGQQWYGGDKSVKVDAEGIHLFLNKQDVGAPNGEQWTSSEVDLVGMGGDSFHPGFGTYLVSVNHQGGFNDLANNKTVVFGAFLYQKDADTNNQNNPHHELDMIEASRFGPYSSGGWQGTETNAQFTLQDFTKPPGHGDEPDNPAPHNNPNVHRFTLNDDPNITLTMVWKGADQAVTFNMYYGKHDLDQVKSLTPNITWTTAPDQNYLIPGDGQQTVHFNLWRQPPNGDNDLAVHDDEVTITNFQYTTATNIIP